MTRQCRYCNQQIKKRHKRRGEPWRKNDATVQHILPKRRGGTEAHWNLTPCCHDCNEVLAVVGDCPGALACMRALGQLWYGKPSNENARHAAKRIGMRWEWLERGDLKSSYGLSLQNISR